MLVARIPDPRARISYQPRIKLFMTDSFNADDTFPQNHQNTALGRLRLRVQIQEPVCFLRQRRCEGDGNEGSAWSKPLHPQLGP
jgi:hypothetical protein